MKFEDDRTPREKLSHTCLILGVDIFLSGWGRAKTGKSYAVWACEPNNREKVKKWVVNRSDMRNVREVERIFKAKDCPNYCEHCHIYVVSESHPALN